MPYKTVNVEILRPGPRHNHLLSPVTQYLGICGDNPAGMLTVPYEHAEFERLRAELRYEVSSARDVSRVAGTLGAVGTALAKMLATIPGVPGLFNRERDCDGSLTHLRLTLSASELALLPFELCKIPVGCGAEPDDILALHQQHPTCLTRHSRSVSTQGVDWLTEPRILFIGGGGDDVPFDEHLAALVAATLPWLKKRPDPGKPLGSKLPNPVYENPLLTALRNPSLAEIRKFFGRGGYTHVHILAHGAEDPESEYQSYGIHLGQDVVSGERLATTLAASTDHPVPMPRAVTLATCDSAAGGDVIAPDSSVAFDLHRRGVPLVVASQFPLSINGSVPFVENFYREQLRGTHPLETMFRLRMRLYSEFGQQNHDWASLVVYEAFPDDFPEQLETLRYWQMRRAQDVALELLEKRSAEIASQCPKGWEELDEGELKSLFDMVAKSTAALPMDGAYEAECVGLKAAGEKRLAGLAFDVACESGISAKTRSWYLDECVKRLENCLPEYRRAAELFLNPSDRFLQRKANLHWLLTQVIAVELILDRPFQHRAWNAALYSAEQAADSDDKEERAWSHSSLAELFLLRLADEKSDRRAIADKAERHAKKIVELSGRTSEQATSTARQIQRYIDWWGHEDYLSCLRPDGSDFPPFWRDTNGIVETARRLVAALGAPGGPNRGPRKRTKAKKKKASRKRSAEGDAPGDPAPFSQPATRVSRPRAGRSRGLFSIEMLPAENGDCLWIEYGSRKNPRRILIDCGAPSAARLLDRSIRERAGKGELEFELFVLTHIDADHISGAIPLFEDATLPARFGDVWFNGWHQLQGFLSVRQGEAFSRILGDESRGLPWNRAFTPADATRPGPVVVRDGDFPEVMLPGRMKLTLLSPTTHELTTLARHWRSALDELREKGFLGRRQPPPPVTDFQRFSLEKLADKIPSRDRSVPNGSSIAFLAEYGGRSALFTGDAHANVLAASIRDLQTKRGAEGKRMKLDAFKLSHHGSANALTNELLNVIDCSTYLVPTDGSMFYHPDREAIARVVLGGGAEPSLCFNYRSEMNGLWGNGDLMDRYGYRTEFPDKEATGLAVEL